jgi:hypothetical protein
MGSLGLLWFETVDVAKHPFGVEEIDLFHLIGGKSNLRKNLFKDFHILLTSVSKMRLRVGKVFHAVLCILRLPSSDKQRRDISCHQDSLLRAPLLSD